MSSAVEALRGLGLELLPLPDGSIHIRRTELERRARTPGSIVGAVVWNGVTWLLIGAMTGQLPGNWEVTEAAPGVGLVVMGFFALIGLSWIWQLIWTWCGREEWKVGRNRLEVHQYLFGVPRRRVYEEADFQLQRVNADMWYLSTGAGLKRRYLMNGSFKEGAELSGLFDLAELLSSRSGWRLRAPERPRDGSRAAQISQPVSSEPPRVIAPSASLAPELRAVVEKELDPGEQLLWLGRPEARRVAMQAAPILIFGIPWTLFALYSMRGWDLSLSPSTMVPAVFTVLGLAMCSTPGVFYLKAQRTTYAVTDRRVLIVVEGKQRTVESYGPDAVNAIERHEHSDDSGDLVFARRQEKDSEGSMKTVEVKFIGIPNVREVEQLLRAVFTTGAG